MFTRSDRSTATSSLLGSLEQDDVVSIATNPSSLCLPPEIEEGNIEYKLKLIQPSPERFQQLVSQLKWRLSEGQGEALYGLGVSDGGALVGMTQAELDQSLATLRSMAHTLGAEMSVIRIREVSNHAWSERRQAHHQRIQHRISLSNAQTLSVPPSPSVHDSLDEIKVMPVWEDDVDTNDFSTAAASCDEGVVKVAEVLVRRLTDDRHFLELRLAFLGGTDAGKSTLLGYLAYGELDNGRGRGRLNLLRHRHELETGHSSSISHTIIGFDSAGNLINFSTSSNLRRNSPPPIHTKPSPVSPSQPPSSSFEHASHNPRHHRSNLHDPTRDAQFQSHTSETFCEAEIVDRAAKLVMLIDSCGHWRFMKTTLQSLTGYDPNYACLVVNASAGNIDEMTREVMGCAVVLNVSVFVVITKIDVASADALKATMESLLKLVMHPGSFKLPVVVQTEDDVSVAAQNFANTRVTPIFLVSLVSGENLDLLVKFINLLPAHDLPKNNSDHSDSIEYRVEETYQVPGVGTVVGGLLRAGSISVNRHIHNSRIGGQTSTCLNANDSANDSLNAATTNPFDQLFIGPMDHLNGAFIPVHISSIHRQRREGMVILNGTPQGLAPCAVLEFEANMLVLFAPDDYSLFTFHSPSPPPSSLQSPQALSEQSYLSPSSSPTHSISASCPSRYFAYNRLRPWGNVLAGGFRQSAIILGIVQQSDSHLTSPDSSDSATPLDYASLKTGDRVTLRFRFTKTPEFLRCGARLLYREISHDGSAQTKRESVSVSNNYVALSPNRHSSNYAGTKMVGQVSKLFFK